jgi:formylglycine-generating enzyme required for sulfatase activity
MAITRNAGATYVIPTENEWYKAAYYAPTLNGGAGGYWTYPTKSNTAPSNILSSTGTNNANYYDFYGIGNGGFTDPTNFLTPVGAFAASPGPYGTFDMGGDVFQWNEATVTSSSRGFRGGAWDYLSYHGDFLPSSARGGNDAPPSTEGFDVGFRVVYVPEPSSFALLVGAAIIGLIWWRRRV